MHPALSSLIEHCNPGTNAAGHPSHYYHSAEETAAVVVTAPVPTVAAAVVGSTIVVGIVEVDPIAAAVVEADPTAAATTVAAAVVGSTRSVVPPVAGQQPQHALHELYDHCECAARYTGPPALPQPQ